MLTLYIKENCPYSTPVLHVVDEMKIPVTIKDVSNNRHAIELIEKGGKFQVPCLIDSSDENALYESAAIMNRLEQLEGAHKS